MRDAKLKNLVFDSLKRPETGFDEKKKGEGLGVLGVLHLFKAVLNREEKVVGWSGLNCWGFFGGERLRAKAWLLLNLIDVKCFYSYVDARL